MSFTVTFFGPRHYWWRWNKHPYYHEASVRKNPRVWFYRPDEHSTGGVGFCLPGLHVCFTWGKDKVSR